MALPKIDAPVYDLILPLSKKKIRYRPFLVKEQRNLMMAMESNEPETIEKNIKQVLHNCTLTEDLDIDSLPIVDVEYYFIQLRARSVGEVVENKYKCENVVEDTPCGNLMDANFNLLEIQVNQDPDTKDEIQLTDNIFIKLRYPTFSVLNSSKNIDNATDLVFEMILDSIEHIFDGEQFFYAKESSKEELVEFVESLNTTQFGKIEEFFSNLPTLNKKIEMDCKKCGFHHIIDVEGLENFFG
jgi:T4 bacteriophage base plate protein